MISIMQENHLTINNIEETLNPHSWVNKYANYLYTYAIYRINDSDLARDLVQETFLAGLESKDKFEGRSTEKTWLTAILKNKIVDIYRSKSKRSSKKPMRRLMKTSQIFSINMMDTGTTSTDLQNLVLSNPMPWKIKNFKNFKSVYDEAASLVAFGIFNEAYR